MIQYKTTSLPCTTYRGDNGKGVKAKEFYRGLTLETCNKAVAPIGQIIQNEAKGG